MVYQYRRRDHSGQQCLIEGQDEAHDWPPLLCPRERRSPQLPPVGCWVERGSPGLNIFCVPKTGYEDFPAQGVPPTDLERPARRSARSTMDSAPLPPPTPPHRAPAAVRVLGGQARPPPPRTAAGGVWGGEPIWQTHLSREGPWRRVGGSAGEKRSRPVRLRSRGGGGGGTRGEIT